MPANLYESVCVPDLGDFLGYQGANNSVTTAVTTTNPPELKSPATPASSITSTSSIPRSGPPSIQSPINAPPIPRPYHNDSEYWYNNYFFIFVTIQCNDICFHRKLGYRQEGINIFTTLNVWSRRYFTWAETEPINGYCDAIGSFMVSSLKQLLTVQNYLAYDMWILIGLNLVF